MDTSKADPIPHDVPPPELSPRPRQTIADRIGRAALILALLALCVLIPLAVADAMPLEFSPALARLMRRTGKGGLLLALGAGLVGMLSRSRSGRAAAAVAGAALVVILIADFLI